MKIIIAFVIFCWTNQSSFGRSVSYPFVGLNTFSLPAIHTVSWDSIPLLFVDKPLGFSNASPLLPIKARCQDAGGCSIHISISTGTGSIYFENVLAIDTVLDLSEFSGSRFEIEFWVKKTGGEFFLNQRRYFYVDTSHYLKQVFAAGDQILDFNYNKLLVSSPWEFSSPNNNNPYIHRNRIVDIITGDSIAIPFDGPLASDPGRYGGSYLTNNGAFFAAKDTSSFLHSFIDWNNNSLYPLGPADGLTSLKIAGNYAIWSNGLYLHYRNLQTLSDTIISSVAVNNNNDLTRNGDVVYSARNSSDEKSNYNIFRFNGQTSYAISNSTGKQNSWGPLTDGKRIVYVMADSVSRYPYKNYTIQLFNGQRDTAISDMETNSTYAYTNYQINNGFIAYTKLDSAKRLEIWLMDSLGNQWHIASSYSINQYMAIDLLNEKGDLTFINDTIQYPGRIGRRFFANRTTKQVINISSWSGTTFYRDSSWYLALGRMLYKIDVKGSARNDSIIVVASPLISGLDSNYCRNESTKKVRILNLPDITAGYSVIVLLDNTNLFVSPDSSFTFNVANLTLGKHEVKIIYKNINYMQTLNRSFTVQSMVTPDVGLFSNYTNVTNLSDPIIITASNNAGGGDLPLYTFARDRNFSNILQAEGTSNTLNIKPDILNIGLNLIYVRMKTSESCYTNQADIDSLLVTFNIATGIVDPEFPNQTINVFPNPLAQSININGLISNKIYSIIIRNVLGEPVYQQKVISTSAIIIDAGNLQNGSYWLSVYDYKKHKLIGTISMLKQ